MSEREHLIGVWKLLSCEARHADGRVTFPFGPHPRGRLIYHANGQMAALIMDPARPTFAAANPRRGSDEEMRSAFELALAYFGTFELGEGNDHISHHVEASLFPNWAGTTLERFFKLNGNQLIIQNPPEGEGEQQYVTTLVWEKSKVERMTSHDLRD